MSGRASAPASSANLGPGFDVLALALELRCRVTAEPAAEWTITQDGETEPSEPADFVRRAVSSVAEGPFHFEIDNAVPRGRGLGSSAAVAVASAAAALRSLDVEPSPQVLFEVAATVDGHPDNAAAAVFGGLVAVGDGTVRHLEIHADLLIVAGVPGEPLSTARARTALSDLVQREIAVRSLARLVFLIEGLRTADPDALAAAGGDEMHERPRRDLSSVTGQLIKAARSAGALHASWSGAGPSAIAFALEPDCEAVEAAMATILGDDGEVMRLEVATSGWR